MHKHTLIRCGILAATLFTPTLLLALTPGFNEDFESGLLQWTGRNGGSHNGAIVADPLAAGHGGVVHFTSLSSGGDMFASNPIHLPSPVTVSFDYLGLPGLGGTPHDLGGFLGIAYSLNPTTDGVDIFWYAGTQPYPSLVIDLEDDGDWHHYSFQFSAAQPFHLMLEDFSGSGGVAGDVYFDNLCVVPVPEPATLSLAVMALLLAKPIRRQKRRG